MLLALLRASLHEKDIETAFFEKATHEHWKLCYKLAAKHGVMALAWDSVMRLPKDLQPPRPIKLPWASAVESYEQKYHRYCSAVDEVTRFYAEHGIATMQMKGVGFSTLYPVPCHREGGDIDIYTYSADKNRMSDQEANRLADKLMQEQGVEVETYSPKHSNFYYKGIPFENHKTFLNVESYKIAVQVDRILHENMQPERVRLAEGEVMIPSPLFNTLFIGFHAMQHYGSGLALHHLCDWVMILRCYGLHLPEEIKDKKLLAGFAALTRLCNQYLGTSQPVEGGEDIAVEMMNEILSPRFSSELPTCNKVGILLYKTRRLLHGQRIKSKVLNSSLAERIWKSFVAHVRHPETIFRG
ncbi:MAG: nucleotidyltransferase family protein [Bacteroidaceae bacterium]|nr:nucleotidyltransferase family protein [Bacteroidaceae bacterium]